jgi:hypothetical protein
MQADGAQKPEALPFHLAGSRPQNPLRAPRPVRSAKQHSGGARPTGGGVQGPELRLAREEHEEHCIHYPGIANLVRQFLGEALPQFLAGGGR